MRDKVRVLQASDMHIGTAFSGSGFSVDKARRRRRELLNTFRRLCDVVPARDVHLLLLVGDLFEAEWVSESEVADVRHWLGQLAIPVLITPGNHDALLPGGPYSFGAWPPNVHIFGPEPSAVTFAELGVTVHGYGYGGRWVKDNPMQHYRVPNDGQLHIAMIHGSFDAPEGTPYWPITEAEVRQLGADYTAFGHYHNPQPLFGTAGLLQAAYAGSLEPLGYDEEDAHGAFLLDIVKGGARVEWLPLAERECRRLDVNVEQCTTLSAVVERVTAAVPTERVGRDLLDITFTGPLDPALWLDPEALAERLEPLGFHLRLHDRTHPDIAGDSYAPHSAPGRYIAKLRERLAAETDEQQRRVIEKALVLGLTAYERGKVVQT